jgi:hypothetical protein
MTKCLEILGDESVQRFAHGFEALEFGIHCSHGFYCTERAFRFERTYDYELVRQIVTHPKVYKWMQSDGAVPAEEYRPPAIEGIWYVLVKSGDEALGLFMLVPQTNVAAQVHACLLPAARPFAVEIYRQGIRWLWEATTLESLIGFTPSYNFAAARVAEKAGMKRIGVVPRSLKKFGKLQDQIVFATGRCEWAISVE